MSPSLRLLAPHALTILRATATAGLNPVKALLLGTSSAAVTRHAYLHAKHSSNQLSPGVEVWCSDALLLTGGGVVPRSLQPASSSRSSTHTHRPPATAPAPHCHAMLSQPVTEHCSDTGPLRSQGSEDDKQRKLPSAEQLKAVSDHLSSQLPQIFKETIDYSIMAPDIIFDNKIHNFTSKGIMQYQVWFALFRVIANIRFAYLQVDLLSVTPRLEEGTVTVHWRIKAGKTVQSLSKVWKRSEDVSSSMKDTAVWHEGLSTYTVSPSGVVVRHTVDDRTPSTADGDSFVSKLADRVVAKSGGLAIMSGVSELMPPGLC